MEPAAARYVGAKLLAEVEEESLEEVSFHRDFLIPSSYAMSSLVMMLSLGEGLPGVVAMETGYLIAMVLSFIHPAVVTTYTIDSA